MRTHTEENKYNLIVHVSGLKRTITVEHSNNLNTFSQVTIKKCLDTCTMYLGAVDGQARCSVELLMANVALEVLGFLVVNEYLIIIKFSVAIPSLVKEKQYCQKFYIVHINTF